METHTTYVAGLLFSPNLSHVLLIRKKKPLWQKDKLNGVGDKIEGEETPEQAMLREFSEEAGEGPREWTQYLEVSGINNDGLPFGVHFFHDISHGKNLRDYKAMEAEKLEVIPVMEIHPLRQDMLPNLPWLVALAVNNIREGNPRMTHSIYS